jgi:hypothetical protein
MHSSIRYEYEESIGEDYVRIIELLPGERDDTIQCKISLEHRHNIIDTYDAISYTWGEPRETVELICSGKTMFVTKSLADALQTIRKQNSKISQRLWADAVCINQSSIEEKNHQVKQMGYIYENARQVFVWLGFDEDNIAADCFSLLQSWNIFLDKKLEVYEHPKKSQFLTPQATFAMILIDGRNWINS